MNLTIDEAVDFALVNGLLKYNSQFKLTHAPFSLTPFVIPGQINRLLEESTPLFNQLMVAVGSDREFLKEHLAPVAKTDAFINRLLSLNSTTEPAHHLQISRNDFLFTADFQQGVFPKQVEFNTISNSFLYLSQQIVQLHKQLEPLLNVHGKISENRTLDDSVAAFADVISYYGYQDACLLMIVQKREQNIFDQRGIEYELWKNHQIRTVRKTLEELTETAKIKDGHLVVDNNVIALTYFRAGYTPDDYQSEAAWQGRTLIENSSTVKCPSLGMQLAGAKKVQQVLARPGILNQFLPDDQVRLLLQFFVGMYDLNEAIEGLPASQSALQHPENYVLKPQREGGGNNLYGDEMSARIRTLSLDEAKAYVLMERIITPMESSVLVVERMAEETMTISEVGRYGACLFDGKTIRFNKDLGYLVRTKASDQNEGGVCAGYACLNSLCCQ